MASPPGIQKVGVERNEFDEDEQLLVAHVWPRNLVGAEWSLWAT
jgi:hypothetical protein